MPRATTFPQVSASPQTSNLPMQNLDNRFHISTASIPNLRQGFQDLVSPSDLSNAGTPESSSSTNHSIPQYGMQDHFNASNSIPYLTGLMFPSTDPFAYPNQPMMEFDAQNLKQENNMETNRTQPMFMGGNGTGAGNGMYDDLEGQLFGPLPSYMMQGTGSGGNNGGAGNGGMMQGNNMDTNAGSSVDPGFNSQNLVYNTGMSLEGIFDNMGPNSRTGDEWNGMGGQGFG